MKIYLLIFLVPLVLMPAAFADPFVRDNNLVVQKYVSGICCGPTTMAFVGNDILVLQKWSGEVRLIHDGVLQDTPVLRENVTSADDQGMLGIDVVGKKVYLYFTEASSKGGPTACNCVYSYDWDGQGLVNRTLVKSMPHYENYHVGGVMATGLDGTVYLVVGEMGRAEEDRAGVLQNNATGAPDDTGVIMPIAPPGPYYAMGIRNSFGLAVDPVTGNLWETENGPDCCDEINLVWPYSNLGWSAMVDPTNRTQVDAIPHYQNYTYHAPKFTWIKTVAPTAISFVDSAKMPSYRDSMLVGDCNNGNLYRFHLNSQRDGLVLSSAALRDGVANLGASQDEITLGSGFGCITDIKVGPDGLVYIVSYSDGAIYRLVPRQYLSSEPVATGPANMLQEGTPYFLLLAAVPAALVLFKVARKREAPAGAVQG